MGNQFKEVGGGPATGLANDFVSFLQNGLMTGQFGGGTAGARFAGANPGGSTMGIAGVLNDILAGGAGQLGGSLSDMISKDTERQTNALRARFGVGGGQAFGSPAAYAESMLRAEQAPRLTQAIGGLQMQALNQLMPIMAGLAGKGISQRETIAQPNPIASGVAAIAPIAGAVIGSFGGPGGTAAGAQIGSSLGNALGGSTPYMSHNQTNDLFQGANLGMQMPAQYTYDPKMWAGYNLGY